jgi:phytoene dehydrogenase-like protein
MEKSIIIIGAGISGLSTGCYGQMNGYRTKIFESHSSPGGLCTSWKRKGYTFDGCIHWLAGSGSGGMHQIWEELGAVQGRKMINHEESGRVQGIDGKTLIVYTNVDRLERHMLELAPADKALIEEFCGVIRLFSKFDMPVAKPKELYGPLDYAEMMIHMLPFMKAWKKYTQILMRDFINRFRDPFLREALLAVFGDAGNYTMPDFSVVFAAIMLAWYNTDNAGFPTGGSLEFARAIEQRYLSLGGTIQYKSRVKKVLVEGGKAVGVTLEDGSEHHADIVISASDGYNTIFNLLGGKYIDDKIRTLYEKQPIYQPCIQVSMGIARDFSSEPQAVTYKLEKPITIAGEEHKWLSVKNYCCDPSLAPAGKSVLAVLLKSNHAYWKGMYSQRERYEAEKVAITRIVVAELERVYPGIEKQIEVVDVTTPLTYERYTGNWQGSPQGWVTDLKTGGMGEGIPRTLPGLDNFYMVGQWVGEEGCPGAAMSGRNRVQLLCKKDGKKFITTKPAEAALVSVVA